MLVGPAWAGKKDGRKGDNIARDPAPAGHRTQAGSPGGGKIKLTSPKASGTKTSGSTSEAPANPLDLTTRQVIKSLTGEKGRQEAIKRVLRRKREKISKRAQGAKPKAATKPKAQTVLYFLTRQLSVSDGQPATDDATRPKGQIVSFSKASARKNGRKPSDTNRARGASKTETSDVVMGEQTVVGYDANGLPRYAVHIPGKPRLLRHLARFMEAMGAECMPTSDGSTIYASGTLSCLLMPGTNSRYVGKRQRLVDYLKNQLYALREKGQVTDTAVEDTSHLLSNASSFIVGSDGKIRLVPQVAVDLYKQSGFLASGEAGDYHSAATVGDGA